MMIRTLVLGLAIAPLFAQAAIHKIATCQIKGEGPTNEFVILSDSRNYARAFGVQGTQLALVNSKNADAVKSLESLTDAVMLTGFRTADVLHASGMVELPSFNFTNTPKPKNMAQVSLAVSTLASNGASSGSMIYTIEGRPVVKLLVCE